MSSFIRLLAHNLRITFFIVVAVVGVVVGYALITGEEAHWFIVVAIAAGMTLSSAFNAYRDSKRSNQENPGDHPAEGFSEDH